MTHNRTGVRKNHNILKTGPIRTTSYQINKLVKTRIISKNEVDDIYYIMEDIKLVAKEKITIAPRVNDESGLIEKKRVLKSWKQSFGYYCLYPEEFKFGLRDFKSLVIRHS
jgi:hypothetical protein